ncbi:solute carrier family 38 (sodium-coupled neutral amino acid transporter), member 11 [Entomortierella parvispora]|uniref:Solute carrier family 38 (Sodium-coupled neutral amino acid transporter), member 11 n=1 Tax=Entomortierella parvispora TaxID=205924 RepID=A0A9P3LW77_9FUNG|nr:solute carrier family 38 (sodium-coupled neutral amino acid transporter), member 11 [Entomortierella parvispora]
MPAGTTTGAPTSSASNGYRRYSMGESGNESGSDTTALQSNQHVKRTNSFTKKGRSSSSGGFDPDRILFQAEDNDDNDDEDDLVLHLNSDAYDPQSAASTAKVPLVSYKKADSRHSRTSGKPKSTAQPKRQGEYGRISHDSFHSGYSEEFEEDDDRDDFGQEEEDVGMMTGNRTNRSGIGNGGGGGHGTNEDAKLPDQGGSLFNSFLNMANSIIGAGIIGLPFAFQEAGLGMGIILLCVLTWIVDWTVGLLVHNGKLSGRQTYQDLLMFCFGKAGLIMISIFQFIFAFGAMCAYTVIVGDTLPHVLQALIPGIETWPYLGFIARRTFVITFCTVLISFPLSLYRDISKLAKTSAVAMLALVVIIIAVMIEGPRTPTEIRGDPTLVWSFARPKLFQSIGVISFAFVCHHNSFLIFGSLQKPTMNRFKLVTHMSMTVSLLACLILALSGYMVFSDKTQGNILNNFPSDNFIINIARFCFGVNMFTTLPLETFVCREVIETYYYAGLPFSMKRHFIITTGLVGAALVIALLTCNLGFVLEVTGGFSATALAFILPPLCYLKLSSGSIWSVSKIPHLACLAFGVAVMILSTLFSLQHFLAPPDASASQCSM